MDCRAVLFLCLSLVTCQNGEEEGTHEPLHWMKRMEKGPRRPTSTDPAELVHGLVYSLLNATFQGSNQTWQTSTIQTLAFKLGCDFAGLSLYSDALGSRPPGSGGQAAGARHAMQFPTELTKKACRTRRRELRLICMYFFTTRFFPHDNSSLLNDYVLGAQLGSEHVDNLMEPINISFWHNQSLEGYNVTCVFWKEGASKHHWGLWSPEGCRTEQPSPSQVLCRCNHLSYFAVLMSTTSSSTTSTPNTTTTSTTSTSTTSTSNTSTPITTITSTTSTSNTSTSNTNTTSNTSSSTTSTSTTITSTTSTSTTITSTTSTSTTITSTTSTPNTTITSTITITSTTSTSITTIISITITITSTTFNAEPLSPSSGVPALLVLLLLAIKSSAYGRHTISLSHSQGNSTGLQHVSICWVQSPVVHHVLVMGYGGLTTLFNLVVLAWALRTLRRLKAREEAPGSRACRDTVTVLGLTVLLGTTWALAFFSFGIFLLPQLFLFTIFNSLYGFFLFLWFCSQRCRAEAEAEAEKEAFSSSQMMH
uniref:Adhesion G protein-coupled receptor G5 n=1 Tax=Myotis lucifugus TaxID=59463 RepID=G1PD32_MYOLU